MLLSVYRESDEAAKWYTETKTIDTVFFCRISKSSWIRSELLIKEGEAVKARFAADREACSEGKLCFERPPTPLPDRALRDYPIGHCASSDRALSSRCTVKTCNIQE